MYLFYLIFSNNVKKQLEATNNLDFFFLLSWPKIQDHHIKSQLFLFMCWQLVWGWHSSASLLQSIYLLLKGMNTISCMIVLDMVLY